MIDTISATPTASTTATVCEGMALFGAAPERGELDSRVVWDEDDALDALSEAIRVTPRSTRAFAHIDPNSGPFTHGIRPLTRPRCERFRRLPAHADRQRPVELRSDLCRETIPALPTAPRLQPMDACPGSPESMAHGFGQVACADRPLRSRQRRSPRQDRLLQATPLRGRRVLARPPQRGRNASQPAAPGHPRADRRGGRRRRGVR